MSVLCASAPDGDDNDDDLGLSLVLADNETFPPER